MKRYIRSAVASPQDDDLSTRRELARTTRRPELLQQCFDDEHYLVQGALLYNPNTPDYMLDKLCSNTFFASQASCSSRVSPEVLRKILSHARGSGEWDGVYENLAGNPKSPEDVLRKLWDRCIYRSVIIRNPSVPLNILKQAAKSDDSYLRQGVAENANCPTDILVRLAKDPNKDVKEAVSAHKNTPEVILQELAPESYIARCRLNGVEFW